jgi:hypothetical protein
MSFDYDKKRRQAGKRSSEESLSGRDIAPLPEVVFPERRQVCERSFRGFSEHYFPNTFDLGWSEDHLKVIEQIEDSVLKGGLFATAMPRGSGKTTLSEVACIWAAVYGHRNFICLIGSDEGHASQMLESIKTEFEVNELLLEDFPEVCYPIQRLEGIAHRCNGQIYDGERTHIGWTAGEVVLPSIPGSKASSTVIKVAGITGGLRGMKFKRPDGVTVRPSLVVVDDPQTDGSARSPSQCATRERILAGAVLGLAGPGKKIAGIMPCTVIAPGDMADNILNRDKHPDWNGTRTKMVYAFPANEKLWEEYGRIRADGLRAGDGGRSATEFYRKNQPEMDLGSRVAWEQRFNHDELSAIQHAMNLKLRDERAFFAEYQNEPLPEQEARNDDLTADQIAHKFNRMARRLVAVSCNRLTAFIDIHATLLYYVVCGWEDDFTGYIVDYGTFPDQKRPYFSLRDAKYTLATVNPKLGLEGQIFAGLDVLTDEILGKPWMRDDGTELQIERCPIDANWGPQTETIYQWCRQSKYTSVVMPSHGKYVGAGSMPMSEYKKIPGDQVGLNWRIGKSQGKRPVRKLLFDTNFWKSFVHSRLGVAMGDRGCLSLFGDKPQLHQAFSEHLSAEHRIRTEGRGRTVDEWKVKPNHPDNHWFDCLVGATVAASIQGVATPQSMATEAKKAKVSFSEIQAKKRRA